jgi:hypothetical protein
MDHKGLVAHFDFLFRGQQIIFSEKTVHTQQQNPHINLLF